MRDGRREAERDGARGMGGRSAAVASFGKHILFGVVLLFPDPASVGEGRWLARAKLFELDSLKISEAEDAKMKCKAL